MPPAPPSTGTPVCDNLTEIGDDLNTLQFGPSGNEYAEVQAIGTQLSKVVAEDSQQSSDLSNLEADYHSAQADEGSNEILTDISNLNDDFSSLESDCSDS